MASLLTPYTVVQYICPTSTALESLPLLPFLRILISSSCKITSSTPIWIEGLPSWVTPATLSTQNYEVIPLSTKPLYITFYDAIGNPTSSPSFLPIIEALSHISQEKNLAVYIENEWKPWTSVAGLAQLVEWFFPASTTTIFDPSNPSSDQQFVFEEDDQPSFEEAVRASGGAVPSGSADTNSNADPASNHSASADPLSSFLGETKNLGNDDVSDSKKRKLHHSSNTTNDSSNGVTATTNPSNIKSAKTKSSTQQKQKPKQQKQLNSANWVYVTGLPPDVTALELSTHFSKCGVLDLDPITQLPKVKIYTTKSPSRIPKGDASIRYARPESIQLSVTLLDNAPLRPRVPANPCPLHVTPAVFKQKEGSVINNEKKAAPTEKQRRTARLAKLQKVGWDEGSNGRIAGGETGLTIVVVKNAFAVESSSDDTFAAIEVELRRRFPATIKMTVFDKNAEGVVMLKFKEVAKAEDCIKEMEGGVLGGRQTRAIYWDGVTDYTSRGKEEVLRKEEEERLDKFGDWLDDQELPEELRV